MNKNAFCSTAKLEKNIAVEIVNNEVNVENDVTRKLSIILENHIGRIQKQKRIVTKLMQDNESAKNKYQVILNQTVNLFHTFQNHSRYNWICLYLCTNRLKKKEKNVQTINLASSETKSNDINNTSHCTKQ